MSESSSPPAGGEKKKSDLIPRLMTAVVMVPILIGLIIAPHWAWWGFIVLAAIVGFHEINAMLLKEEAPQVRHVVTGLGVVFYVGVYLFVGPSAPFRPAIYGSDALIMLGLMAFIVWSCFLFHLMRRRDISRVAQTIGGSIAGILYVGVGFVCIVLVRRDFMHGSTWVLLTLALCWFSDTGAYFAGRAFGKRKLAPLVSPAKSVEGAFGGMAGSIVAASTFGFLMIPGFALWHVLALAVPANILAQTGDLCESLLKRSCGVKDSGTIIHGHGGMLDRVDAVLFVSPYVYLFAHLVTGP